VDDGDKLHERLSPGKMEPHRLVEQGQGLHSILVTKALFGNRLHRGQTQKAGKMHQRAPRVAMA